MGLGLPGPNLTEAVTNMTGASRKDMDPAPGLVEQAGYLIELRNSDFPDPADLHQSRQNLAVQVHWAF